MQTGKELQSTVLYLLNINLRVLDRKQSDFDYFLGVFVILQTPSFFLSKNPFLERDANNSHMLQKVRIGLQKKYLRMDCSILHAQGKKS